MSSKSLVWAAFAFWCIICTRWYVCSIKEVCDTKAEATTASQNETPAPTPLDTASTPPAALTTEDAPPKPQESNNSIDNVQVVELGDDAEIHFPYNSTDKEENASIDEYLSKLASALSSSSQQVTIIGHSDGIGDANTNLKFAERRAKNIRDILIEKGVNRKQITTKSYGESKPKASNDTPEGRFQNRRVEIIVGN